MKAKLFLWKNNKIGKPLPRDYQGRESGIRGRRRVKKGVGRRKGKAGGEGKMRGGMGEKNDGKGRGRRQEWEGRGRGVEREREREERGGRRETAGAEQKTGRMERPPFTKTINERHNSCRCHRY